MNEELAMPFLGAQFTTFLFHGRALKVPHRCAFLIYTTANRMPDPCAASYQRSAAMQLNLSHISYTYPGASFPALDSINAVFPQGWTGIIGDNGCGKTTLALIAARQIAPISGSITPSLYASYCSQDASVTPSNLYELADNWSHEGRHLRELLGIDEEWFWRYETLSGGQQRRIQIACALFSAPDVLVMDEPTNDLDSETRTIIKEALASFKGIGLLISHDRDLLDSLVSQSLIFDGRQVIMRPGGYTKATDQAANDRMSALRRREKAKREVKRIEVEAQRRRQEASLQKAKRSGRGLGNKDNDARERIGRAIISGKDGVAGKLSSNMDRRLARANESLADIHVGKRYEHRLGDWGTVARSSIVSHVVSTTLQAGDFSVYVPELWIDSTDHVTLSGRNGTGKSLVVHYIVESTSPNIKVAYIPQGIGKEERERALKMLRNCTPDKRGRILSVVAHLNSDPERLLDGSEVSPGELRKLLLAEQLIDDPNFLVLDEPTNHLDIGSIEALQNLLVRFPGAVLLVSHDAALLDAVSEIKWSMTGSESRWQLEIY